MTRYHWFVNVYVRTGRRKTRGRMQRSTRVVLMRLQRFYEQVSTAFIFRFTQSHYLKRAGAVLTIDLPSSNQVCVSLSFLGTIALLWQEHGKDEDVCDHVYFWTIFSRHIIGRAYWCCPSSCMGICNDSTLMVTLVRFLPLLFIYPFSSTVSPRTSLFIFLRLPFSSAVTVGSAGPVEVSSGLSGYAIPSLPTLRREIADFVADVVWYKARILFRAASALYPLEYLYKLVDRRIAEEAAT